MLVVDLLHEFELGVWKSLFIHLIRLLYAAGKGSDRLIMELNARFVYAIILSCFYAISLFPDIARSQHLVLVPFASFPELIGNEKNWLQGTTKTYSRSVDLIIKSS